jgi:hypothetical protein
MYHRLGWALAFLLPACGSGSDAVSLPAEAEQMRTYLKDGVTLIMPRLGGAGSVILSALNPGSSGASGIQFDPDPSVGAPPNSYIFSTDLDGDGDGTNETNFTGSAVFNGDPANAGDGFGGHVVLTMQSAGGLGTLTGDMDFLITAAGGEVSGTGSFTEAITGNTTTLSVDQASPLHIQMARGTSNSVANACASSLDGDLRLDVAGPTGTMTSKWGFKNNRKTVAVTSASFTDTNADTTDIPDANVTIPCGQQGHLSDWNGAFTQQWVCVPAEFGSATLTLSASGSSTINISDEDPPASGDVATYSATVVSADPHVVRGFFIGGDVGNTYREDFSWLLADDGNSFSQVSRYVYQEGPNQGGGGICGGKATLGP